MPILKPVPASANSIRVERVPKKNPLKPAPAGVVKLSYNTQRNIQKNTAKTAKPAKASKLLKAIKPTKAARATRGAPKQIPKGLVPIASFRPNPRFPTPSRLLAPPREGAVRDSVEVKPGNQRPHASTYLTPSPTPSEVEQPLSTPRDRLEGSLRSLQGFDFGPSLRLTAARQTELAAAFDFDKSIASSRASTCSTALQRFLEEVLSICVARGDNYKNTARASSLGLPEEDHAHFFFSEVATALDSLHSNDNMWVSGYGKAGLRPQAIMGLVDVVLGARLNFDAEHSVGVQTELTKLSDKWADICREKWL